VLPVRSTGHFGSTQLDAGETAAVDEVMEGSRVEDSMVEDMVELEVVKADEVGVEDEDDNVAVVSSMHSSGTAGESL
jgi:hypothetical protein